MYGNRLARRLIARPLLAGVLALTACATNQLDVTDIPSRQFAGHITVANGGYWFQPCGAAADVAWWITFVDRAVAQLERGRGDGLFTPEVATFARLHAAVTDERHVGPGGTALLVRDMTELRPARAGDCDP